jgi:chromosome segregation ATPase
MSAADDVLAALEGELKSASTVQRLSKRLGTISSPKGADHLRGTRTDYPLFAELLKAQEALQKGWAGVGSASRDLAGIRKAVGDRLAGTAWLTQELRHTRLALAESRDQYKTLQREQRLAEDSLSEQGRRIVDLEDKVTALTFDTASSRRDADSTRSELALAQEKLKTATIRTATLRKTEAFKRAEIEGEAIRALEAADAERERLEVGRADLEAEVAIARERGRTSRLKVERLMRALHRDEARGQA